MSKKKKLKPDDPEQFERFVKATEDHFGDDAEEKFEEAIKQILPAKGKETITPDSS